MTRCGRSEWSGVSTLGAGPSASMQPAMKRIISASLIVVGIGQRREPGEREPGEALAADGAEVGPAAFHQQRVAELDRGVAAAGLDQAGIVADEVGKADEAVERIGGGRRHAGKMRAAADGCEGGGSRRQGERHHSLVLVELDSSGTGS